MTVILKLNYSIYVEIIRLIINGLEKRYDHNERAGHNTTWCNVTLNQLLASDIIELFANSKQV
jgi:hypothetical protein